MTAAGRAHSGAGCSSQPMLTVGSCSIDEAICVLSCVDAVTKHVVDQQ